jgi:hypothetical protein
MLAAEQSRFVTFQAMARQPITPQEPPDGSDQAPSLQPQGKAATAARARRQREMMPDLFDSPLRGKVRGQRSVMAYPFFHLGKTAPTRACRSSMPMDQPASSTSSALAIS